MYDGRSEVFVKQKLASVKKIFGILLTSHKIEKSEVKRRRMRIWHSKGLRMELRTLVHSLQSIMQQEKKVALISLEQFAKQKLQHAFYAWLKQIQTFGYTPKNAERSYR